MNETYIDRQFNDVYVTRTDIQPESIQFDRTAVSEVKFVPFERFREKIGSAAADLAPVYAGECRDLVSFLSANGLYLSGGG